MNFNVINFIFSSKYSNIFKPNRVVPYEILDENDKVVVVEEKKKINIRQGKH